MAHARPPIRRGLVVLAALAVAWLAERLALPGLDTSALDELYRFGFGSAADRAGTSIAALGITPLVSGFTLVEIAALIVPRWRPLRHGGPVGRSTLRRASIILGLVLAAIQGWFMAGWLASARLGHFQEAAMVRPGLASKLLVTLTLVGGVGLLLCLMWLVERIGIGNGFSVLIGGGVVVGMVHTGTVAWAALEHGELTVADLVIFGIILVIVTAGARAALRFHTQRLEGDAPPLLPWRLPTSGLVPLTIMPSIVVFAGNLAAYSGSPSPLLQRIANPAPMEGLVVAALAAMGCSLLFNRLGPLVAAVRRLHPDVADPTPALFDLRRLASRRSLLFVVGLAFQPALLSRFHIRVALPMVVYVALVAIVMDLAAEWRFRTTQPDVVAVWPMHRVALVEVALEALGKAGIPAHPRGAHHRALLHFFGPYLPIDLLVPRARAAEAQQILGEVLAP